MYDLSKVSFVEMEPERDQHHPQDPLGSLPIDFLIKILRDHYLPISTLLECRSVCKKWKEVIDGPELQNKIWKKSVIVFHEHRENKAHFCCRDRWITRNLPHLLGPKELVAADGCLLCFGERLSRAYVMYNPVPDKVLILNVPLQINGEHTVIDGMLNCKVVGLVVDPSTKNFKLVLGGVQVGTDRLRTLIYDSTTGTWSWGIHSFPEWMKDLWDCRRSVVCNRCLYWLVRDPSRRNLSALLIFDLEEGTWNALVEESMEATPLDLQLAAYERHVCLTPSNWSPLEGEFERRSDVANFFRNPIVRRIDGALIRRVRDFYDRTFIRRWRLIWNMDEAMDGDVIRWFKNLDYPMFFNFYATGGSDAFFVIDEQRIEFEVVKYWAELDSIFFLPQPPFHSRNRAQYFVYDPSPDDPWCAMIPSPRGSAGQGWMRQQEYVAQQQRQEEEEDSPEALRRAIRDAVRQVFRQAFGQSD
ncbi:hypothetical protein MPTK1_4g19440 [Marchantia polymorpha subsp. ruderalis]|uniref:F-box domain-containing protein n=2 Tax=Marchantia polymorpha TaxID=3197 RepID=A0AAF6BBL0_MARPO|nr:hypothetical protein MARPO_0304s0001 [Marchantia polymorpha]BBN09394.1 hypothetical protein Mp_4g19440 [Marchantia polymorpha subsp. ruderalis]|eukprot:PTQ26865.1 hypothetical protein MARPO_0304s0001 [Marchantia polymorpha]